MLLTSRRIPGPVVRSVAVLPPGSLNGSINVFANGGLFGAVGICRSSRLGRYRLYATNERAAVGITTPGDLFVVTPADPTAFVARAASLLPAPERST